MSYFNSSDRDPELTDEEIAEIEEAERERWADQWDAYLENEIAALATSYHDNPAPDRPGSEEPEIKQAPPSKSPPFPVPCTGEGHTRRINGVLLTDDERLVSCSEDGTIKMWTLDGVCTRIPSEPGVAVRGVVSVDTQRILFWDARNRMYFWEQPWEAPQKIGRQKRRINGVRILSDKTIVLWCDDGVIYIRDASGAPRETLTGHEGRVHGIEQLSDGHILSWGMEGTLRTWTMDGESVSVFPCHAAAVRAATELPDGRIVSIDTRQHVMVRKKDGAVECSCTFGKEDSQLDAAVRAAVEGMQPRKNRLNNERDGSFFEWDERGLIRHQSARNNPLLVFGIPHDEPIEVVGDFTVRIIGGGSDTHAKESGVSYSPSACARWRDPTWKQRSAVRYLAPQRKPRKVAQQLNRRSAALATADQNLHITIRSMWGTEVLEALDRDLLVRITGVQCLSLQVLYAISAILPELQLDILQLSFLPETESVKSLYAIQAKRLVVYECPELRSVHGTNCLISEVAVLGCPLLKLDSRGVHVTGPGGEAEITDLSHRAIEDYTAIGDTETEDIIPF